MDRIPMTTLGEKQLQEELQKLKRIERPQVIKDIAEARAHGDLKENAEYHAARDKQSFIEGRISDLEGKLSMAQVIDIKNIPNKGKVIFGTTVTLHHIDEDREVTYQIVGDDEADITQSKISINSPIARGLIGKFEGDDSTITTPGGEVTYEILKVVY